MSDFKIEAIGDGYYDLVLTDDDFVVVGETAETWPDELQQRVTYEFGTWLGESFWDTSKGFPWLESVFGKQPIDGIAALVYEHAVAVEGVEGMNETPELSLDNETRKLTIKGTVKGEDFVVPVIVEVKAPQ